MAIAQSLNKSQKEEGVYALLVRTEHGATRIPSNSTLGDAGVLDGYYLELKREQDSSRSEETRAGAYLRTETGEEFSIGSGTTLIGRRDVKRGNLVEIDLTPYDVNKVVSRRHTSVEREGDNFYVVDQGSTNGTKLNGRRLIPKQKQPLRDGDVIEFGRNGVQLTFELKK